MHFPIGVSVLDPATTRTRQSRVDLSPACTVVGGKKDTSVMSICMRFDWHTTPLACLQTRCNAGRRMPISSPMIATTTSSSMSVKAFALGILFSVHATGTPDVSREQPPRFTTFTSQLAQPPWARWTRIVGLRLSCFQSFVEVYANVYPNIRINQRSHLCRGLFPSFPSLLPSFLWHVTVFHEKDLLSWAVITYKLQRSPACRAECIKIMTRKLTRTVVILLQASSVLVDTREKMPRKNHEQRTT